ncbi:MAG: HPF/RaiA family ribosome-associated protein [Candidatus Aenigmatarchaeota archaeon]
MAQVEISHAPIPEKFEIEEEVGKFLEKFEKIWNIQNFRLDVDVHSPEGRKKYSFHAKVKASDEIFVVQASGWDVPSALNLLFDRLGKKIGKILKKKKEEKIEVSRKLKMKAV